MLLRARQVEKLVFIGDSMVIIWQMRNPSTTRYSNLFRLIDKIQSTMDHFDQITFYHVLRHQNSKAHDMANRGVLLNQDQMIQNVGEILLHHLP
jgi:hypothetical protein